MKKIKQLVKYKQKKNKVIKWRLKLKLIYRILNKNKKQIKALKKYKTVQTKKYNYEEVKVYQ